MKFKQVLHVDQKEIEILNEALKMYRSDIDHKFNEEQYGELSRKGFASYRCKIHSMTSVFNAMKKLKSQSISEASEHKYNTTIGSLGDSDEN